MNYLSLYDRICRDPKNLLQCGDCLATSLAAGASAGMDVCVHKHRHLIIPAGIWGSSNTPENTTYLTTHQQIVAYKLLVKIYPYSKNIAETLKSLLRARGRKRRKIPLKRKPHTAETRAKMSQSHRGKRFSMESRIKMSEAKKGQSQSSKHVANKTAARKASGQWFSPEARLRMSVAAKNRQKPNKWSVSQ